jgi:hypothetical protein
MATSTFCRVVSRPSRLFGRGSDLSRFAHRYPPSKQYERGGLIEAVAAGELKPAPLATSARLAPACVRTYGAGWPSRVEPDPAEQAERCGAELTVIDCTSGWSALSAAAAPSIW